MESSDGPQRSDRHRVVLSVVLAVLFVSGWAANHFAAMLPVLADSQNLSHVVLDGAFGIYAVGLLPGLLGGGTLSDRLGRRPLVLWGAAIAGAGNLILLFWHDPAGIYLGRLVVGFGVGAVMSAGTAWCADLGGASGSVLAGVALSAGFGGGPLVSGLFAQAVGGATYAPFAITATLSAAVVVVAALASRSTNVQLHVRGPAAVAGPDRRGGVWASLNAALPMGVWVFACATVAMVTMVERMQYRFTGPWLPGVVAAVTQASGVVIQLIARQRGWGPRAGVFGAVATAAGFGVVAGAGETPSLVAFFAVAVILGIAYGLCLRQGLLDIETLAPIPLRGTLTGVFYTVTYLGFGLPVLLVAIKPAVGITTPMLVLAGLAAAAALWRATQIRRRTL